MQLSTDPAVHGFRASFTDQATQALAAPLTIVAFLKVFLPSIQLAADAGTLPSLAFVACGLVPLLYQLSHFAIRFDGRNVRAKVLYALTMPMMLYFGVTIWLAASASPARVPDLPLLKSLPAWMTQMLAAMVVLSVLFSVVSLASNRQRSR